MVRINLDDYESGVKLYESGSGQSIGWALLEQLEAALYQAVLEPGSIEIDADRGKSLVRRILGVMSKGEEVSLLESRLQTVTDEYHAGLRAFATAGEGSKIDVWHATVSKFYARRFYEHRLATARARE